MLALAAGWHGIGQLGAAGVLAALFFLVASTAAAVLVLDLRKWRPRPMSGRRQVVDAELDLKEES